MRLRCWCALELTGALGLLAPASGHASPNQVREVVLNRGVPVPRYLIVGRVWQNGIAVVKAYISIGIKEKGRSHSGHEPSSRALAPHGSRGGVGGVYKEGPVFCLLLTLEGTK